MRAEEETGSTSAYTSVHLTSTSAGHSGVQDLPPCHVSKCIAVASFRIVTNHTVNSGLTYPFDLLVARFAQLFRGPDCCFAPERHAAKRCCSLSRQTRYQARHERFAWK